MIIDTSTVALILIGILVFTIFFIKQPITFIKILRVFTIFTALCCVSIYFLVDSREDLQEHFFNNLLYSYVFFTWFLLYLLIVILSVYDIFKLVREKNIKYFYYLIFLDILIPYLGLQAHHVYFENVF